MKNTQMPNDDLKFFNNEIWLKNLVNNSFKAIDNGYYEVKNKNDIKNHSIINLKNSIKNCYHVPLIAEIKFASPSKGKLVNIENINVETIAYEMEQGNASAISILSQPYLFNGSINYILKARTKTRLPILMKDIIVSDIQIKTARDIGADCILLIKTIFDNNLTEGSLEKLSEYAKKIGLQVIVETHFKKEFEEMVKLNKNRDAVCDIIGINNRNLNTLKIDLDVTNSILSSCNKNNNMILSESGINSTEDILYLKKSGADAFLIGSSLMENIDNLRSNIEKLYISY